MKKGVGLEVAGKVEYKLFEFSLLVGILATLGKEGMAEAMAETPR